MSIVLEDELLEFVNDRQLIIELVDLLVDELNQIGRASCRERV